MSAVEIITMIRGGTTEARERALRVGSETLPEEELVELLREEADDVARNAGLEMLKLRGRRSFSTIVNLLSDEDHDVVLQAVLLADATRDASAWPHLQPLLHHEDANVVQAVIVAAGRIGGAAADIIPFLQRDTWLQMAAIASLGELRAREAVGPIADLMSDPTLGFLATEALGRIGGPEASRVLAELWLATEADGSSPQFLPLLAEALIRTEEALLIPDLRIVLGRSLADDDRVVREAAAKALLSLGPGDEDGRALDVLMASTKDFPACLARRADLAEWLLGANEPARNWGYQLALREPDSVRNEFIERLIVSNPPADIDVLDALARRVDDLDVLVTLFLSVPAARAVVAPRLSIRAAKVRTLIEEKTAIGAAHALLLMDAIGLESDEIVAGVGALSVAERSEVVRQLRSHLVIAKLPWRDWLEEDRAAFAPLLGEIVTKHRIRPLLPLVREELERDPSPQLIVCAGTMRDHASVPLLIAALSHADARTHSAILEAIAAIGGGDARRVLEQQATCGEKATERLAARAVAKYAEAEDCSLLRKLAISADWAVRYHAAEALGRFPKADNVSALMSLASDSSAVVAQRARGWLNSIGSNS